MNDMDNNVEMNLENTTGDLAANLENESIVTDGIADTIHDTAPDTAPAKPEPKRGRGRPKKQIESDMTPEEFARDAVSPAEATEADIIGVLDDDEETKEERELRESLSGKILSASKSDKRNIYNDSDIIALNEEKGLEVTTEEHLRRNAYLRLVTSMKTGAVLEGLILKSEVRKNDEMPTAFVQMENDQIFDIKIKITDLIPKYRLPKEIRGETTKDKLNYLSMLINQRGNSPVSFVITGVDELNCTAEASRIKAMNRMVRADWFERDKRTDDYVIKLGQRMEANVIYVDRGGICVEAHGFEEYIEAKDVSWLRYTDISKAALNKTQSGEVPYKPGDKIIVRIMRLRREVVDGSYKMACHFSIKEAYTNPEVKYYTKFNVGDRVQAEVTHVDENGVFVKLSGLRSGRVRLTDDAVDLPSVGDRCCVRITRMFPENYNINCEMVQRY